MVSRTSLLLAVTLLTSACASLPERRNIDVLLTTYDDWGVGKSEFCNGEPVVFHSTGINAGGDDVAVRLCSDGTGFDIQASNERGELIWGTKESELHEQAALEASGDFIFAPRNCSNHLLKPGQDLFENHRWDQRALDNSEAAAGRYVVSTTFIWIDGAASIVESRSSQTISIRDCDGLR